MKRVLHAALVAPGYSNEGIMKGFLDAGFDTYRCFDYQRIMFEYDKNHMRRILLMEAKEFKPDLIFCQIQNSEILDLDTFNRLNEIAFTVNYNFDIRSKEQSQWMYDLAPYIGLSCLSNQNDVNEVIGRGYHNAMCLHSSTDIELYKPATGYVEKEGIVFIGNNFHNTMLPFPKSEQRIQMVQSLKPEFGNYFEVYGMGWFGPMATQKEEIEIYQHAFAAINQTNYDAPNYTSDRLWRILATGCFCLTEYFEGIESLFTNHEELVWWRTIDELKSLLHHYMANGKRAQQIGMNGYAAMRSRHTWKNRIEEMMAFINKQESEIFVVPMIDSCTKAGAHVVGGIIPGQFDEHLTGKPCDCGKLKGVWQECGCAMKRHEFRWTENI